VTISLSTFKFDI